MGLTASVFGALAGGSATGVAAAGAGAALLGKGVKKMMEPPAPPEIKPPVAMPDPLEQEKARQKSIVEQLAMRGRSGAVLTDSGGGKLGG